MRFILYSLKEKSSWHLPFSSFLWRVWGMLGEIMKLVNLFLIPFNYNLLLVFQAEKEWMTEKRREYFQTQILFRGLQLFRGAESFSWISKNGRALNRGVYRNLSKSFFLVPGRPSFQPRVDCPSSQKLLGNLLFFVFIYFILCLFY